jgi:hypothetical protein
MAIAWQGLWSSSTKMAGPRPQAAIVSKLARSAMSASSGHSC